MFMHVNLQKLFCLYYERVLKNEACYAFHLRDVLPEKEEIRASPTLRLHSESFDRMIDSKFITTYSSTIVKPILRYTTIMFFL